jgi:hypothetical protein
MEETPKVSPVGNPYLKVIIIDDESEKLSGALGMTDERYEELGNLITKTWKENKTITDVMSKVSLHAKHANELVLLGFMIGALAIESRQPDSKQLLKIKSLLENLRSQFGEDNAE